MGLVVTVIAVALPLDWPAAVMSANPVHCAPPSASKGGCSIKDDVEIKSAPNEKDLPAPATGAIGKVPPVVHSIKMWN
ncbi:Uncharacterised protein [Mycobacteroides abscessus subsp. bolletii]|nr:Uncharacterised protein [Mycobacteroides abscessus subsp. bolletii]